MQKSGHFLRRLELILIQWWRFFSHMYSKNTAGGGVAQLVEHQTGKPLKQIWFPGATQDFSPRINFQCRLSHSVHTPLCTTACINICVHIKRFCSSCQSSVDYGNTKTPSMHCRLGSKTVAAGFPWGKQPGFPMGEIPMGQYSWKKKIRNSTVWLSACTEYARTWPFYNKYLNTLLGIAIVVPICLCIHPSVCPSKMDSSNHGEQ